MVVLPRYIFNFHRFLKQIFLRSRKRFSCGPSTIGSIGSIWNSRATRCVRIVAGLSTIAKRFLYYELLPTMFIPFNRVTRRRRFIKSPVVSLSRFSALRCFGGCFSRKRRRFGLQRYPATPLGKSSLCFLHERIAAESPETTTHGTLRFSPAFLQHDDDLSQGQWRCCSIRSTDRTERNVRR